MPELPEVEITRRSFADRIAGATVHAARVGKPLRWPLGCDPASLAGATVGAASRRGKYIWLPLAPMGGLLWHLGMSGSLRMLGHEAGPGGAHDHFDLVTSQGVLRLHDPRRFGAVVFSPAVDAGIAAKLTAALGREPFDAGLDGSHLHAAWRTRRAAVKLALLAGDVVVGAGNIYACEALFHAGIDPRLPAMRLSRPRAQRLLDAVRRVLARALEVGGSSLRDFVDAHGDPGAFQLETQVYGREGQPCRSCGTLVRRITQGQRSTFFCPNCQRR